MLMLAALVLLLLLVLLCLFLLLVVFGDGVVDVDGADAQNPEIY